MDETERRVCLLACGEIVSSFAEMASNGMQKVKAALNPLLTIIFHSFISSVI